MPTFEKRPRLLFSEFVDVWPKCPEMRAISILVVLGSFLTLGVSVVAQAADTASIEVNAAATTQVGAPLRITPITIGKPERRPPQSLSWDSQPPQLLIEPSLKVRESEPEPVIATDAVISTHISGCCLAISVTAH